MKPLVLLLALLAPATALAQARVIAVNGPLAAIAEALAGDAAEVIYPVPEGADPMLWRPAIADIADIQSADILLNGAGFAPWTDKVSLPRSRTIVTTNGLEDRFIDAATAVTHSHGPEGEHSHTGAVSETWLDPELAIAQSRAAAAGLARAIPDARPDIEAAAARLEARLYALLGNLRTAATPLQGRTLASAHPGLDYFARAAGFDLATLDWPADAAPDAADIAALDQALASGAAPLMLWPAPPPEAAATALTERGITPVVIDPAYAARDALEIMDANVARLATAASGL